MDLDIILLKPLFLMWISQQQTIIILVNTRIKLFIILYSIKPAYINTKGFERQLLRGITIIILENSSSHVVSFLDNNVYMNSKL